MKTFFNFYFIAFALSVLPLCHAQRLTQQVTSLPVAATPAIVARDANSCVWQWTEYEQGPNGQTVPKAHQYTELASGLCYQQNGQWVSSQEQINILPDGSAAATNGQYQVFFPGNIYNGVIKMVTPDSVLLQSQPIALSYDDGTNTVLIAVLTNSVGELINSNEVLYPNAFVGVDADLHYTYRKGGFEQDVILRAQPPTPESLGLNPQTARLEVLTEFIDPPNPVVNSTTLQTDVGGEVDENLDFGATKMVPGNAFLLGTNQPDVRVTKQWLSLNGRQILAESVPIVSIADSLNSLPSSTPVMSLRPSLRKSLKALALPQPRFAKAATNTMILSGIKMPTKGFVLDYVTVNSGLTNYVFRGDTTYLISGTVDLYGTNIMEGGTVIKYASTASIVVMNATPQPTIIWPQTAYRPAILTSCFDNSVGDHVPQSGLQWSADPALQYDATSFPQINICNLRLEHFIGGIELLGGNQSITITNAQFDTGLSWGINIQNTGQKLTLENALFANISGATIECSALSVVAENVTFANISDLLDPVSPGFTSFYSTNCIFSKVSGFGAGAFAPNPLTGSFNGFYDTPYIGTNCITNLFNPFQIVGAGSFYLTTNCPFHNTGTNLIDPALLNQLVSRTTYPPTVFSNVTISAATNFFPNVSRDTNSSPDLGYHYDPLDYIFGGCNFSSNVSFTNGTAVGWFQANGSALSSPYAISLTNGANVSFDGNATQPCIFTHYLMVQEGTNGVWTNSGFGGIVINGSGNSLQPQLSANFTKWTTDPKMNVFNGNSPWGFGGFLNCEFYNAELSSYLPSMDFTNCLFFRDLTVFNDEYTNAGFNLENCTFYNGGLSMARTNSFPALLWTVENTSFDGTGFSWYDSSNGSPTYTVFNYNAYNTNNFSWMAYTNLSFSTNTLEVVGPNDTNVDGYNWQSSWFGNFYLPINSLLIRAGSTSATNLGLYHFTTQANQVPEGNNIVDIGYHYVATDTNGVPLSTPGDGIPDYLADANGNGIDDPGETNWDIAILSLTPQTTNVAQGQPTTFSVTVGGIGPFNYQWQFNGTNISGANGINYSILVVQTNNAGSYTVIANNSDGSVTSSVAVLQVTTPPSISSGPNPQTQTVAQGTNISFSVTTSGNYLQYQWYNSSGALINGSGIGGATNSMLTISNVVVSDSDNYYVVITNLFGSVTSSLASLTVLAPPNVATNLLPSENITQSEDLTLNFDVTNPPPLVYQWYFSNSVNTNIQIGNNSSYTQLVVQTNNTGLYSVTTTNLAGSTNGSTYLTVFVPPWIGQQPTNILTNAGAAVTFTITNILGSTNLYYFWFENGTNPISGATNNCLTLNNVQMTNAGGYSCLVSNFVGTIMSARAWLSVSNSSVITNGWGNGSLTNPPPLVCWPTNTSPTNPYIISWQSISIRAFASSQYSYMANVTFYFLTNMASTNFLFAGNAVYGPDTLFALAWSNSVAGTNILQARAQDCYGSNSVSQMAYVLMTTPPDISVESGTNVMWIEGTSSTNITLFGTISDDGQPYCVATNIHWTLSSGPPVSIANSNSLNPTITFYTNGTYNLAFTVDNDYQASTKTCKINIERRPQISFITPTNNEPFLTNTPIVLRATASAYYSAISNLTFYTTNTYGGQTNIFSGLPSVTNTYAYLWNGALPWTNVIFAVATDNNGLSSTSTASIVVGPLLAVWITAPANGRLFIFSPTNLLLSVSVIDFNNATVTNVVFTNVSQSVGLGAGIEQNDGSWQLTWYDATNGIYTITATAEDNAGDTATNTVTITNNAMPVIVIINPNPTNVQSFTNITNVTLHVKVTDSDGTITNVQFYATNSANLLGTLTNANAGANFYDFVWSNRLNGTYPAIVVATDNRGASTTAGVVFKVNTNNPPPSVQIGPPTDNELFVDGSDITIIATVTNFPSSVTNVEFFVNGESIGSVTNSPFSIQQCCWTPGTYTLQALASDDFGNSVAATNVQITVMKEPTTGYWDPTFFTQTSPSQIAVGSNGVIYLAGGHDTSSGILASYDDGLTYQAIAATEPDPVTAFLADGPYLYVGGGGVAVTQGTNLLQSAVLVWDGSEWAIAGDPNNDPYSVLTKTPNTLAKFRGNLYMGVDDTNGIYEFNTVSNVWIPVGNGLSPGPGARGVLAIAGVDNTLYIGGDFTDAGGNTNANYIACLINNTWTNVGSGIAPLYWIDPFGYPNPEFTDVFSLSTCQTNLFVGGCFTTAGSNTNAYGIAIWNGSDWQTVNGGVTPSPVDAGFELATNFPVVNSVLAHGNRVFVGGPFDSVFNGQTTVPASSVAMVTWNEASHSWVWSDLDGGVNYPLYGSVVNCFQIASETSPTNYELYVGGSFSSVGTSQIPDNGIARWRVGYPDPTGLPTVIITNPFSGASFTVPTNLTFIAVASSSVGISNVTFYVSGQDLGQGSTNGDGSYSEAYTASSAGIYQVIAVAKDNNGVIGASKPITIDVKGATNAITAADVHYSIPENNPPINFYVLTNCSPTNGLTISQITELPPGFGSGPGTPSIGIGGQYVRYTPLPGRYGTDFFYYTVSNAAGSNDSATVTVNIYPVPQIAITNPIYSAESVATTNGTVSLVIGGTSSETGGSVTNVSLYTNGVLFAQTNNFNFNFNWSTTYNGVYTFVAVATDNNGITNASSPVTVISSIISNNGTGSTSTNQVIGKITNLANNIFDGLGDPILTVVSNGIFDLKGNASVSPSGPSFPVAYQVILCTSDGYNTPIANITPQADSGGFHEGGDNSGDLGTINLSTFANGVYDIQLSVYGGGTQTNITVPFILNSQLKIGQFSFSEQDLSLPVNGIPVTITRTYNSQNPNSTDFGYGWTMALNSMNVQLDEQRQDVVLGSDQAPLDDNYDVGDGPPQTLSVRTGGGWDVTLTLPNGQQTTFAFSVQERAGDASYYQALWTAPPWIHATLTAWQSDSDQILLYPSEHWAESDMSYGNASIDNQDFPGWKLTTSDGTVYDITRGSPTDLIYIPDASSPPGTAMIYGPPALTEIEERSGDKIVVNPNSIYHQDPKGTNSAVVNISRDSQGRITAISDPNAGPNGLPLVQYVYDQDNGNLIQVLKLQDRNAGTYATNFYDYNNPNLPHYITSIENANGVPVTRNYYDGAGRLIQTVDALGHTNQFIYAATNLEMTIDPLGRTNSSVYDASGNIIAQTNALSQVKLMAYDGLNEKTNEITFHNGQPYATNSYSYDPSGTGFLLSSMDPLGHTNGFTYNGFGEATSSSDARGNTTYNNYDNSGELTTTVDALGNTNQNVYNAGLLTGSIDPIGTTTTNYYDPSGNLTSSAMLDGSGNILSSNTYTYDANNNRLASTVWRHVGLSWTPATTANFYDAQNRVTKTINPDGGTNTIIYNLIGQQAETIDPLGHTNLYFYDAVGRLLQTTYPDGTSETSAYDAAGNRTNSLDRLQRPTAYVYDALNRMVETVYPDGATNAAFYDDLGRVAQTIDARGTITANAYDAAGRRIAVMNAFGISSVTSTNVYGYDPNGNQITFTDANGHTTTNIYDVLNRQVQVLHPDGTTNETVYDGDGRTVIQINQDGFTTHFTYDGAGRLTAVTNALNRLTQYQYDEAGNKIVQIDALLRANAYTYDGQGRRISHTMPGGQSEEFAYDLDGNQIYATNFNGAVITNTYDVNNRLINVSSIYGYNVSYAYSATGQRTNMIDPSGTNTYVYDNRDRLLLKTVNWKNGPTVSLNYLYDANGNIINLWETNIYSGIPGGVANLYQYDPLNRLTNVLANGSTAAAYAYDLAGNLQALRYGNGVTNQYQYDSLNRLTNLTWNLNVGILANFSYQLGLTGNRMSLTETNGGTNRLYTWQYDHLYRLTNEAVSITGAGNLFYQYDSVGNRTNRSGSLGTLAGQINSYNPNDWLTNTDKYDANGSTTNSGGNSYQYDAMNHVTNAWGILMTYDGDGNRVNKKVNGTNFYYLVDDVNPSGYAQILEEWTVASGATNLSKVYNYGLDLISQRQPNLTTNYFVYDGHGSTRMLVDNAGNTVNVMAYDAYGNLIASNGVLQTGYLYSDQQYDSDLGLYYNRARYLNTGTGRFWTSDATDGNNEDPLSLHKYLYAEDDPVDNSDPLGLYTPDGKYTGDEGDAVHFEIGQEYNAEQTPENRILCTYGTPAGIGKNTRYQPDILNKGTKTYAEIKPLSINGINGGYRRLDKYDDSLQNLGYSRENWPGGTYSPIRIVYYNSTPYFYFNVRGLILYTAVDPGFIPIIPIKSNMSKAALEELAEKSAERLATRGATTLTEALAPRLALTGVAEAGGMGASFGAATANTVMSGGAAP